MKSNSLVSTFCQVIPVNIHVEKKIQAPNVKAQPGGTFQNVKRSQLEHIIRENNFYLGSTSSHGVVG